MRNKISYADAKKMIQANNIRNRRQYWEFRKSSSTLTKLLPFDYVNYWVDVFESNAIFFNTKPYSIKELMELCALNDIYSSKDYLKFKKESTEHGFKMPYNPKVVYNDWITWDKFFIKTYMLSR